MKIQINHTLKKDKHIEYILSKLPFKISHFINQYLKEYPQLKDSIQYDFVRLMAEAMIAQNFNREDEATETFQTLINSHQQQIGSNAALSLTEIILGSVQNTVT